MPEQATSAEVGQSQEISELREELSSSREEILRLRDLLIAKDAELGVARGRLAELEEHAGHFIAAATRLQSRIPGLARLAGAPLRRLRGRRS